MRADEATIILQNLSSLTEKFSELSEGQAVMKSQMTTIQATVTSNTILLRGNGVPGGIVTDLALIKDDISELKELIPGEVACRKEMLDVKTRVEGYPTYSWLLRNKTKQTLLISLGVVLVFFVLAPMVDHSMLTALLTWVGFPAAIIKNLVG